MTHIPVPEFVPPTLAAAIAYGEEVFSQVLEHAKQCPKLSDGPKP
eukprot:CAMPEP_0202911496 /NCGR_PEP_ID=MMETSP1392-20130828/55147_1 /ASSEMBLY_ACC=CAM_ASM_000868 /TAXON_ID=225041 /ORGANISM="Chlamydomonas chlamydogama, Strain SAG 11-48b" /LENGTH=44 /DNA_ID= /DNA_START= /DNA_END= /DNA_ORIENTATION=